MHMPLHRGLLFAGTALGTYAIIQLLGSLTTHGRWYWRQWCSRRNQSAGLREVISGAGPLPLPFLGNSLYFTRVGFFRALYESCLKRQVTLLWFASSPLLVVSDANLVKQVLTSRIYEKPRYFGYRSRTVKAALELHQKAELMRERIELGSTPESEANVEDPSRAALLNLIDDSINLIAEDTERFFEMLVAGEFAGKDTYRHIQQFYVKLNCKVLFGLCLSDKEAARIAMAIEKAGDEFSKRMILPQRGLFAWTANVSYIWNTSVLLLFGQRILRHLRSSSHPWIHGWVGKVGRLRQLAKVLGLLMAATQTVPIAASWALISIGSHDKIRRKLVVEARRLLAEHSPEKHLADKADFDAVVTSETIAPASEFSLRHEKLKSNFLSDLFRKDSFIDATIRETLRLYPPFPIIQRQAQCDNFLGDVLVPAGAIVAVVPWLMHHHPAYWNHAEVFDPDRWTSDGSDAYRHGDAPSDYCYIPFGRGRRMCAGNPLAMIELKCLVLFAALREHDWCCVVETRGNRSIENSKIQFPSLTMRPPRFSLRNL
ncbi:hypothetical protein CCYA_CCYA16G4121 [Cyanidiococcus yangmingshanensis]|uniref:Cytochrome P450 n=1 Tax=Cyanidiococcus yangmingshanensis TaxID=2690220 RepID=A0A7J7IFE1_9RHOD|nr:hypothetical protein F1559_001581 [Cyanidiococcus yangmingshanensis]KAK4533239.1 hypothetical protein CCYA_CCYA16G4121 [Cyanidiococcus yangmingshanensis]